MTNRDAETRARITVQKELKAAAKAIKTESFSIDEEITKRLKNKKKTSRLAYALTIEDVMDDFCANRLVSKENIMSMQRTSKHAIKRWSYLERNDEYPFEYFENQIFSIFDFFMNTRKPQNAGGGDSGIRITRHCLERVSERFDKSTLQEVLGVVSIYASTIGLHHKKIEPFIEGNQVILLTKTAYLVVKTKALDKPDGKRNFDFIITTILPRTIWSKRRQALLAPAIDSITDFEKGCEYKLTEEAETLLILKPSYINSESKDDFKAEDSSVIFWISE
jgi:hypothetical protein